MALYFCNAIIIADSGGGLRPIETAYEWTTYGDTANLRPTVAAAEMIFV